jgi:hypothetical protein
MTSLDAMLSGRSEHAPEAEKPETTQKPEATTEQVKETPETPAEGEQPSGGQKMVPHEALHAEKQKVKRYTEQIASFEQKLTEQNQAWERRFGQMIEAVKPKQEPTTPPDPFENPAAHTMHTVAPHLERFENVLMANAKLIAGAKFGDDKVDEAEKAFIQAYSSQTLDPADYQKVVNSPNRYAEAVKWHKRQLAAAEIGDDPAAYREKLKSELMAELQQKTETEQPAAAALNLPSNMTTTRNVGVRTGPAWGGPKPLGDIFKR